MTTLRVGIDENGLGARLGPLIVTAVSAQVTAQGEQFLRRKLRGKLGNDLGDSKALVAHGRVELAEAWARVVTDRKTQSPAALVGELTLEPESELKTRCPKHALSQCWTVAPEEQFEANEELLERIAGHRAKLASKGIELCGVRSAIVCTRQLNDERATGKNRFVSDLNAMERLLLRIHEQAGRPLHAVCGKVGGMADYARYFGPLGGRLHAVIEQRRERSGYRFPGLGDVYFVKDADSKDALVMMASLVGKYVRELLMTRIWRYYALQAPPPSQRHDDQRRDNQQERALERPISGYNDPRTGSFVTASQLLRQRRRIPSVCFERVGD